MMILGMDLETTDLDIENCEITEMGMVLWDTNENAPVDIKNFLCYTERPISEEAAAVTGISESLLMKFGCPIEDAMGTFKVMASQADAIAAHNGTIFDRPIYERIAKRVEKLVSDRIWIDTRTDIPYPRRMKSRNLITLAAEHGFLNPFPHRAVTDVLAMFKIMAGYPMATIIERAQSPTVKIKAVVSYEERQMAKDAGFHWDGHNKIWHRAVKLCDLKEEMEHFGFEVEEVV